jgi:putative phosphonate transport system ATP-binding protein
MSEALLEAAGLRLSFGAVKALDDVAIDIHAGEVVAIVG